MEKLQIIILVLFSCIVKIFTQEDITGLELDWFEKDKILTCAEFINRKFQQDAKIVEEITSVFGPNRERVASKISGDMFSLCYNKIDDETVKNTFSNLTFYELDWTDDLAKFVKVDYAKYRNLQDLELSPEQQLLFYKLEKTKNDYIIENRARQEKAAKSFPPIFGFDFTAVSPQVKLIYTLIVFAIFALGIVYALKKVGKSKNEKKKSKKNK